MSKGITPIIAIVLLLLITLGVIAGVNFFISSFQTRAQTSIEETSEKVITSGQQAISPVFKKCNGTSNEITLRVRNVGTVDIEGGEVQLIIRDEQGDQDLAFVTDDTDFPVTQVLEPDKTIVLSFDTDTAGFDLANSTTYSLEVILPGGVKTTTTCKT